VIDNWVDSVLLDACHAISNRYEIYFVEKGLERTVSTF